MDKVLEGVGSIWIAFEQERFRAADSLGEWLARSIYCY